MYVFHFNGHVCVVTALVGKSKASLQLRPFNSSSHHTVELCGVVTE